MKKLLVATILFIKLVCLAQNNSSIPYDKTFIKLKTGKLIFGKNLDAKPNFNGNIKSVILDGEKYALREMDFYNNGELYGNMCGTFVPCSLKVKNLNFFKLETISYSSKGSQVHIHEYYSVGITKMKKLKIHNLVHDLTDNPEAYTLIKKANTQRIIMLYCFLGALGSGVVSSFMHGEPRLYVEVLGLGSLTTALVLNWQKNKNKRKALAKYTS